MSEIAISVNDLSKLYRIGAKSKGSLKDTFNSLFNFSKKTPKIEEEFWALKDVSFEVKQGEVLGVIGRNGAGKSTLLKILSRITVPSKGSISINGRVSSLLEVGTGFHPELSGRENIFLNGTILGMKRQEIKSKLDEIIAFSGVDKFLDTPVKHYSSGMYVRLAFAVAAHLEPEILIIDEVLAVGDAEFQKKCIGKMKEVAGVGRTVIFVSHSMSTVSALCKKGLYLKQGQIEFFGQIEDTISKYLNVQNTSDASIDLEKYQQKSGSYVIGHLTSIQIFSSMGNLSTTFKMGESISIHLSFSISKSLRNLEVGFVFLDASGITRQIFVSNWEGLKQEYEQGEHTVTCNIPQILLMPGFYSITCWIKKEGDRVSDQADTPISFEVIGRDLTGFNPYFERYKHGGIYQNSKWNVGEYKLNRNIAQFDV